MSPKDNENLRECLTDMSEEPPKFKRTRSESNEKFELPPLPDFDDNKDLKD